jgi:hypothetical protein
MNIVLANSLYKQHSTDEGDQLQEGLRLAGFRLVGYGYEDDCTDVKTILERYNPEIVVIQAREDWDENSPGCFDKRVSFTNMSALATHPSFKIHVVKDCPGAHDRRKAWCEEVKTDAILIYYHPNSVLSHSPWMANYPLIRHRHTIDPEAVRAWRTVANRLRGVVSGAISQRVYPLRTMVSNSAVMYGVEKMRHPGYGNIGSKSAQYIIGLSQYKVSVACSSVYGFNLRKILESAAAGCMVVTDLPEYDDLPWLNESLVRVRQGAQYNEVRKAIDDAAKKWSMQSAEHQRNMAIEHYDYVKCGKETAQKIIELSKGIR